MAVKLELNVSLFVSVDNVTYLLIHSLCLQLMYHYLLITTSD